MVSLLLVFQFILAHSPASLPKDTCAHSIILAVRLTEGPDLSFARHHTPASLLLRPSKGMSLEQAALSASNISTQDLKEIQNYLLHFTDNPIQLEERLCQILDCEADRRFEIYHNIGQALLILFEYDYELGRELSLAYLQNLNPGAEVNRYAKLIEKIAFRLHQHPRDFETFIKLLIERNFQFGLYLYGNSLQLWLPPIDPDFFREDPHLLVSFLQEAVSYWTERSTKAERDLQRRSYLHMAIKFARFGVNFCKARELQAESRSFARQLRTLKSRLSEIPSSNYPTELNELIERVRANSRQNSAVNSNSR